MASCVGGFGDGQEGQREQDLKLHRLGPRDYVLCIDEKTSIQARRRKHRTLPPAPGRPIYVEHEYVRAGALAYLAACS